MSVTVGGIIWAKKHETIILHISNQSASLSRFNCILDTMSPHTDVSVDKMYHAIQRQGCPDNRRNLEVTLSFKFPGNNPIGYIHSPS